MQRPWNKAREDKGGNSCQLVPKVYIWVQPHEPKEDMREESKSLEVRQAKMRGVQTKFILTSPKRKPKEDMREESKSLEVRQAKMRGTDEVYSNKSKSQKSTTGG